jgi:hypothetical protein
MVYRSKKADALFITILLAFIPIVALPVIFSAIFTPKSISATGNDFRITYHSSSEYTYQDISIIDHRISYTYAPGNLIKCQNWVAKTPCWTSQDLITRETDLTDSEYRTVHDLADDQRFLSLQKTYGGASRSTRYYPVSIRVHIGNTDRETVYQSFPQAKPMPDAFKNVAEGIVRLAQFKFP